jgi:hypothetical protein
MRLYFNGDEKKPELNIYTYIFYLMCHLKASSKFCIILIYISIVHLGIFVKIIKYRYEHGNPVNIFMKKLLILFKNINLNLIEIHLILI